jgi:uncharacterized protein YndB with AHSA1/START domain
MVTVSVARRFAAAPDDVFDAWIDPDLAGRWLFRTEGGQLERCEIDPRVGGGFRIDERRGNEVAEHYGHYVALERPRWVVFDFWTNLSEDPTRVTVEIAPDDGGVLLTLTHEGVGSDWEEKTRQGWTMLVEKLASALAPWP